MTRIISQIRPLTQDERLIYTGAAISAVEMVPAFRDAIAILRPFFDGTAGIAYTDQYSRVGLAPSFFEFFNPRQRASIIIHEAMHVLQGVFNRAATYGGWSKVLNVAADFEINCGLDTLKKSDVSFMVMPDIEPFSYPQYKSLEQYYALMRADPEIQQKLDQVGGPDDDTQPGDGGDPSNGGDPSEGSEGGEGSGSEGDQEGTEGGSGGGRGGNAKEGTPSGSGGSGGDPQQNDGTKGKGGSEHKTMMCDDPSADRSASADEQKIDRSSEVEKSIAMRNTAARVSDEKRSLAAGNESMNRFLGFVQEMMTPPKVSWQSIFRRAISKMNDALVSGRADYSYRRTNRRAHDSKFVFPGMVQFQPTLMVGLDTSGSMAKDDYMATYAEVEAILKIAGKSRGGMKFFSVDASVQSTQSVKSLKDIQLQGGGGTKMDIAFTYVNSLSKKEAPDIFVLATDGGTDWTKLEKEFDKSVGKYLSIILVTNKQGFQSVPKSLHNKVKVIDISED